MTSHLTFNPSPTSFVVFRRSRTNTRPGEGGSEGRVEGRGSGLVQRQEGSRRRRWKRGRQRRYIL